MWNRGAGSGRDAVLEVVLFPGGDDPTREPVSQTIYFLITQPFKNISQHNLPPLLTRRAVETLRSEARNQYWLGYHPGQTPPPPAERITGILKALGVWL
jgi:hypothetical protein